MNGDFKGIINTIYKVCDSLNGSYDLGELSMRELMRMDLLKFILYLGAADEEITQEEADFIAKYLEWKMTIPQWCEFINKQNIHSDSILEDAPLSLTIFVDADNKAYSYDNSIMNACDNYIWIFETLGDYFIESDNHVDRREQIALGKYIAMLRHYYEENTKRTNLMTEKNMKEKDENIRVELENRTIVIPKALPETIKRMRELIPLRDEMLSRSEKARDKYDPDDIYASPMNYYAEIYNTLEKYSDKYDKMFKKKYDNYSMFASCSDYLKKYHSVCKSAEDRISRAYREHSDSIQYGMRIAESEAAKEIKGMPFGIITNRVSSLLMYNTMAAITEYSQQKKADETYNRIMQKFSGNEPALREMKILNEEVFPLIYPVSEKATAVFHNDVMKDIDFYENIGYEELSNKHKTHGIVNDSNYIFGDTIALREAINKLQKVGKSKDDYETLLDILEECPYCPEIYFKLIEIGKFDKKVFEVAKILHIEKMILPALEKDVEKRKANISDVKPVLEIIAIYKSQSYEQVLKNTFQSTVSRIKNDYHELLLLCTDSRRLDKWITDNINSDMDKVVATSADTVKNTVASWLNENIEDKQFAELSDMGLINIEDIKLKDSIQTTLEEVKSEYATKLVTLILDYIKEAGKRKIIYEEAYDKFNAEIKKHNDTINNKMAELKQQGMFAFSKKKEIKTEIERLKYELEEFRKGEPVDLKNAYYKMYS